MTDAYEFEINLTHKEYSAVMDIRGLASEAHYLVMRAKILDNGAWLLRGSNNAFDKLLSDIWMEIDEQMAPKKSIPALRRVAKYLTPEECE